MVATWSATLDGRPIDRQVSISFTLRSGRDGIDRQPEPGSASITFVADDDRMDWLAPDQVLEIFHAQWQHSSDPRPPIVWTGTIGDIDRTLSIDQRTGIVRHRAAVEAAGIRARLGRIMIGDVPWPPEPDSPRIGRALALATIAMPPIDTTISLISDPDFADGINRAPVSSWAASGSPFVTITERPGAIEFRDAVATSHWRDHGTATWTSRTESWQAEGSTNTLSTIDAFATNAVCQVHLIADTVTDAVTDVRITIASAASAASAHRDDPAADVTELVYQVTTGVIDILTPIMALSHRIARLYIETHNTTTFRWAAICGSPIDPGTIMLVGRDIDRQAVTQVTDLAAVSGSGVLWETRAGSLVYRDSKHRARAVGPYLRISATAISTTGSARRQSASDRINRLKITYGVPPEEGEQPEVTVADAASIGTVGEYAARMTTDIADIDDAYATAERLVRNRLSAAASFDQLQIVLSELDPPSRFRLVTAPLGSLLEIRDLPVPAFASPSWRGYLEAMTIRGGPDGDVAILRVSDMRLSADLLPWAETDPTLWKQISADLIWDDATGDLPLTNGVAA